jgi:hypothetical protein
LVYNEKVREKIRESKSLNSNNTSIKSKFAALDDNSGISAVKKNYFGKFEEYVNNFYKIKASLFFDGDLNQNANEEVLDLNAVYGNKSLDDVIEIFKQIAYRIIEEMVNDINMRNSKAGLNIENFANLNFVNSRNNNSQSFKYDTNVNDKDRQSIII